MLRVEVWKAMVQLPVAKTTAHPLYTMPAILAQKPLIVTYYSVLKFWSTTSVLDFVMYYIA